MYKIAIDASGRNAKTVVLEEETDGKSKIIDKKEGDIDLVTAVSELLVDNNLKIQEIADFTYSRKSGSFTGLKMSAAVANMLKYAVGRALPENLPMPEYGGEPNIQAPKV